MGENEGKSMGARMLRRGLTFKSAPQKLTIAELGPISFATASFVLTMTMIPDSPPYIAMHPSLLPTYRNVILPGKASSNLFSTIKPSLTTLTTGPRSPTACIIQSIQSSSLSTNIY